MKSFKALIRREYWEHRGAFVITPLALAAVFASLMLVAAVTGGNIRVNHGDEFSLSRNMPQLVEKFDSLDDEQRSMGVQAALYTPLAIFGFVMFLISLRFCLNSLYDERKDRSILFWKSMPVSDTKTVLSKLVALVFLVPIAYTLVVLIFQIFMLLYGTVLSWIGGSSGMLLWTSSNLFAVVFNSLCSLIITSLWFAPLWGWLMLASAWAKRAVFLWASLPIVAVIVAEGWILNTTRFGEVIGRHIVTGFSIINANLGKVLDEHDFVNAIQTPLEAIGYVDFWVGLAMASGFIGAAIYIRRFRDES